MSRCGSAIPSVGVNVAQLSFDAPPSARFTLSSPLVSEIASGASFSESEIPVASTPSHDCVPWVIDTTFTEPAAPTGPADPVASSVKAKACASVPTVAPVTRPEEIEKAPVAENTGASEPASVNVAVATLTVGWTSGPGEPNVDHASASEPPPAGVKAEIVPPIWLETDDVIARSGSGPLLESRAVVQSSRSGEAAPVASLAELTSTLASEIETGSARKLVRPTSETEACSAR